LLILYRTLADRSGSDYVYFWGWTLQFFNTTADALDTSNSIL
jgi:hypothetical protein